MGVPIDFQYLLHGYIEILISIIACIAAVYYLYLKDKSSSQRNEYTSRSIVTSILYQQQILESNRNKRTSVSEWNTPGQQSFDYQSTIPCAVSDNHDNCDSAFHSDGSFENASVDIHKQLLVDYQTHRESTVGYDGTRFIDEKATHTMDETAHRGYWSEMEKFDKATADLDVIPLQDSSVTTITTKSIAATKETIMQDVGSNQNAEYTLQNINVLKGAAPFTTMTSTASALASTENAQQQQQQSMDSTNKNDGEANAELITGDLVDQLQADADGKDYTIQVDMGILAEPSEQQITLDNSTEATECGNLAESSNNLTRMSNNIDAKGTMENMATTGEYDNGDDNNEPTTSFLNHKKTHGHYSPLPISEHESTNTMVGKDPTSSPKSPSPKRIKQQTKTNHSAMDNVKLHPAPTSQSHADDKPKKDMTKLERIDQQKQPYIALYKSRCEFWPGCTNKHCKYYHPFMECRNGSACKFGNKCIFLHPKDYLDHRYIKQANHTKKKNNGKNTNKAKVTGNESRGNQIEPSNKTVE